MPRLIIATVVHQSFSVIDRILSQFELSMSFVGNGGGNHIIKRGLIPRQVGKRSPILSIWLIL